MTNFSANLVKFPARAWCVRAGNQSAHYFIRHGGKNVAACGMVSRSDCYWPQWSRPRQAGKGHCRACERALKQAARRTVQWATDPRRERSRVAAPEFAQQAEQHGQHRYFPA